MFEELGLFTSRGPRRVAPPVAAAVRTLEQLDGRDLCAAGPTAALPAFAAQAWTAPTAYRGFMVSPSTFADPGSRAESLAELKAWNVNLVRWQMNPVPGRPLLDQMKEFGAQLKAVTADFRQAGIGILLDLHPANDGGAVQKSLAKSASARASLAAGWKHLAGEFRADTAVVGYDVLNEPTMPTATWKTLARSLVRAVRGADKHKAVVVESVGGNPDLLNDLPAFAAKDRVVYSFHMYHPLGYTHQGIDPDGAGPKPVRPPVAWTPQVAAEADAKMDKVRAWQERTKARVFVGEFSVNRAAPGGTEYLNLCLRKFERYGWDWTYHAYKEAEVWDLRRGDPGALAAVQNRLAANNRGPTFLIDATVRATDRAGMNAWTFYPQYYLAQNKDLRKAFGTDLARATEHWLARGVREGRKPNPYFAAPAYLARYADLRAAFGTDAVAAAAHWLADGISEGRVGL